jgi:hypothetical protein
LTTLGKIAHQDLRLALSHDPHLGLVFDRRTVNRYWLDRVVVSLACGSSGRFDHRHDDM